MSPSHAPSLHHTAPNRQPSLSINQGCLLERGQLFYSGRCPALLKCECFLPSGSVGWGVDDMELKALFLSLENTPGQRAGGPAGENTAAGEAVSGTAVRAQ